MRLEFLQLLAAQRFVGHAIRDDLFTIPQTGLLASRRTVDLYPAARTQKRGRAGGLGEGKMLGLARRDEPTHGARRLEPRRRRRRQIVSERERRDGGERAVTDVRARIEIQSGARNVSGIARERVREHRFALNDSGVAVSRFAGDLGKPVDQRNLTAAVEKMQRGRDPDGARAENQRIEFLLRHGEILRAPLMPRWTRA